MKNLGILGPFACAMLLACGGADEPKTGDDQNLTEEEQEIVVEAEGYVVGDFVSGNKATAMGSLDKACEAWKVSLAESAGGGAVIRLATAACVVSAISASEAPAVDAFFVWASMHQGHCVIWAMPSAMSSLVLFGIAPSLNAFWSNSRKAL